MKKFFSITLLAFVALLFLVPSPALAQRQQDFTLTKISESMWFVVALKPDRIDLKPAFSYTNSVDFIQSLCKGLESLGKMYEIIDVKLKLDTYIDRSDKSAPLVVRALIVVVKPKKGLTAEDPKQKD